VAPRTVAAALAGEALFWRDQGRGRIRASKRSRSRSVLEPCVLLFSAGARLPRSTRGPTLYNYAPRRIPAPRRRGSLFSRSLKLSLSRALSLLSLSRSLSLFSPTPQRVDTPTPTSPPKLHCCSLGLDCGYVATVLATGLAWAAALPPPAVTEALVAVSSGVRCRRRRPAKAEAVPARPSHRRRCARADAVVAHVEQWHPHCCWPWALRRVEVGLPPPPPPPLQLALAEPAAAARERRHRQVAAWAEPAGCLRIDERVHTQTSRQRITRACRHTAAQHGDR
jgi:hypothetical protein